MFDPVDVALIGGAGFIGRALLALLVETGRGVRIVSRRGAPPQLLGAGVRSFSADVADAEAVAAAIEGAAAVVYLATGGGDAWSDFERDFISGAGHVAAACLRHNVRRLVYTSSTAALYLGGRLAVDESVPADPQAHRRSFYARAKREAEQLLLDAHRRQGLPVVILRPGIVAGRGGILQHSGLGTWPSDLDCLGWGAGRHPLPFVLVDDVARAMLAALDVAAIEGRSFNLAGDFRPSARQFVAELAARSRRNFRFHPQSIGKLYAVELAKWLIKSLARKPDNPLPGWRDFQSRSLRAPIDCSAARRLLGWRPNADADHFWREAIDPHLRPLADGDLRLPAPAGDAR